MDNFGYMLSKYRENRGFSPEQMGDTINKSERTWRKVESGARDLTRKEIKAVAQKLDISEDELMALGERPIINSFNNNNQEGDNNNYSTVASEKIQELENKIAHLAGRLEVMEKALFSKISL
ncbi:MAG: helix-turn-helix transcriptional regulator [Saprospiraceae bacterium]|nr:helix-turn-helix transcriptional regulator [Saprospiraceae bacterium]